MVIRLSKTNKELAVDLVVAMLEHNSKLKFPNSGNVAAFVQASHITDALTAFTKHLNKLDQEDFKVGNS